MRLTVCIYNIGVGNTELIATKVRYWQKEGVKVKMVCPEYIVPDFVKCISDVEYITIPFCVPVANNLLLTLELLKRTTIAFWYIPQIVKNTNVIYSISSVLDALLLPFIIKLLHRETVWVALFENEVKLDNSNITLSKILSTFFYQISLILLKKTDKIFVISKELKQLLLDKKYPSYKLILTGNAIHKQKIQRALRRKKYICDGLFMGRLSTEKGIFDLVAVCSKVVTVFPAFSLYIAGTGESSTEEKLYNLVKQAKLAKNIKFLGYVAGERKYQVLAGTRLFLFPSKSESFGVALLEAVCSGKKAVVYDLPAYRQIYQHHEIIPVGLNDIGAFADKVITLMKSKTFINRPGLKMLKLNKYDYRQLAQLELSNFVHPKD